MNLNQSRGWRLRLAFFCAGLFVLSALPVQGADTADKKQVIRQARAAYYSLRERGLTEFQANIKPTWEVVLKEQMQSDPEGAQAGLKLLNSLHFVMSLDSAGKVTVNHSADAPPPNERVASGFNDIYAGMDKAVTGFFDSWSPFMLTSPFPEVEGEYQLEDQGGEYRLSYKDGSADVVTMMNKDFTITMIKVTSPEFLSTFRPVFARTARGFILSGYSADYQPRLGPGVVALKVQLEYQEVNGLQLPRKLSLDSVYDGSPTQMELVFADYQVKAK
ncbi:MAG TPA: hypothetical protein VF532_11510 [Candidatus Angelobacter sp.]